VAELKDVDAYCYRITVAAYYCAHEKHKYNTYNMGLYYTIQE